MLRRRRPLLDENDAVRAGVAAIWAAGAWPTASRLAQALWRAEDGYPQRLTGVRWPRPAEELPKPLAAAVDGLVHTGEVDVVEAADGSELRFRPSRALVEEWLPLVERRELRQLEDDLDPRSTPASACLAAAGNFVRGDPPMKAIDDDALVAEELQLRARNMRLVVDRRAGAPPPMFWELEQEASLLAQTSQPALARRRWSELGNIRLHSLDGPREEGAFGVHALEESVLSDDQHLQERVLSLTLSAKGLVGPGMAWHRTLCGLVLDDASAVDQGAQELDRLDRRTDKQSADVALGAAARALMVNDSEAFRAALERTVEQHLRYLRHGSWRGDASPVRAAMVLRVLASRRGIQVPDELFHRRVTMALRCCDVWQGEPVHRHRARGTVDLAPVREA